MSAFHTTTKLSSGTEIRGVVIPRAQLLPIGLHIASGNTAIHLSFNYADLHALSIVIDKLLDAHVELYREPQPPPSAQLQPSDEA